MKKKDKAKLIIKNNERLFKCPVCQNVMEMNQEYRLICENDHSFDLSKKGYLNLLQTNNVSSYSKELFESRRIVCLAGFYNPLIIKLVDIMNQYMNHESIILDAGCGEGSHLYLLYQHLNSTFIGIDIAKQGIQIASRNNADIIWCVADLANLPFNNKSIDIVLNILSPANYNEFNRLLSEEGIVIKVIPGPDYLKELRTLIYDDTNYSNENIIEHFSNHLAVIKTEKVKYQFDINDERLPHLIKMTPLTWGKDKKDVDINISTITVDLMILVGKKMKED